MDAWKRESWILRLLCIFFFQFLFLDGIPLEKGVLDFEIGLWFFVPVLFLDGIPLEKGVLDFEIALWFFLPVFVS